MQFSFTGEQSLPQCHLGPLKRWTFGESMGLPNDHIADEIRMIEEDIIGAADAELGDVPEAFCEVG